MPEGGLLARCVLGAEGAAEARFWMWPGLRAGPVLREVVEVTVPPLREREGDVALLAHAFLARSALKLARPIVGFSREALEALTGHAWPGNVRELQNEVERAVILAEGPLVEIWDLSARVRTAPAFELAPRSLELADGEPSLAEQFDLLGKNERALVKKALEEEGGNVAAAARRLGITRIMLSRRKERFGL